MESDRQGQRLGGLVPGKSAGPVVHRDPPAAAGRVADPVPETCAAERSWRILMDVQALKTFFMWCTVINGGIFLLWTVFFVFAPDFLYRRQSKWFPISRETYNVVMYCFTGLFKIVFLVFNVVPYLALLIVA
jgi:hypothetical protein